MISAADGRGTLFDMLADAEPPRRVEKMDDGSLPMHSQVQVPLGVKRDLSAEPHWVTHLLDEPVLLTRETLPMMLMGVPRTLPGLKDFYMAGQWVEPGGSVPLVAASGRSAIQMICHADGKNFETSLPQQS